MDKKQNPEAADTVQTKNVTAVDLPRLVRHCAFFPETECDEMCQGIGCGMQGLLIKMKADGVPESELGASCKDCDGSGKVWLNHHDVRVAASCQTCNWDKKKYCEPNAIAQTPPDEDTNNL